MRYTQHQIENAQNTDMVLFLQAIEGFSFKRVGNEYHCIEHDSFVIKSDLHNWYWNSQGLCGRNAIDYCIYIRKFFLRNGEVKCLDFALAKTIEKREKEEIYLNLENFEYGDSFYYFFHFCICL